MEGGYMKKKYKKILAALIAVICLAVFGISLFKPVTAKMEVVRYGNLEKKRCKKTKSQKN